MLEATEESLTSALKRTGAAVQHRLTANQPSAPVPPAASAEEEAALVAALARAYETGDVDRLVAPLAEDIGPVLAPDVIADRTLLLWGRAKPGDLIDVDALATRFGHDPRLRVAAAKDPAFAPRRCPPRSLPLLG